jgi:hypothetical protein
MRARHKQARMFFTFLSTEALAWQRERTGTAIAHMAFLEEAECYLGSCMSLFSCYLRTRVFSTSEHLLTDLAAAPLDLGTRPKLFRATTATFLRACLKERERGEGEMKREGQQILSVMCMFLFPSSSLLFSFLLVSFHLFSPLLFILSLPSDTCHMGQHDKASHSDACRSSAAVHTVSHTSRSDWNISSAMLPERNIRHLVVLCSLLSFLPSLLVLL